MTQAKLLTKWDKRMRTILTLVALSFLLGCKQKLPALPVIENHYVVEVRNETPDYYSDAQLLRLITNVEELDPMAESQVARCLKFNVVTMYPYKIKYVGQVALKECDLLGGYKPRDLQKLLNWIDDVVEKFK